MNIDASLSLAIYIYIYRERERERDMQVRVFVCVCVYSFNNYPSAARSPPGLGIAATCKLFIPLGDIVRSLLSSHGQV